MYLNKFQKFVKNMLRNLDVLFIEINNNEEMYLSIINSLNNKINFLENLLTNNEAKYIEIKNVYEEKMLYLIHINNILLESSLNLRKQIEHIQNESFFTKIKKSFLTICINPFE